MCPRLSMALETDLVLTSCGVESQRFTSGSTAAFNILFVHIWLCIISVPPHTGVGWPQSVRRETGTRRTKKLTPVDCGTSTLSAIEQQRHCSALQLLHDKKKLENCSFPAPNASFYAIREVNVLATARCTAATAWCHLLVSICLDSSFRMILYLEPWIVIKS